jgi:hypothetical protein
VASGLPYASETWAKAAALLDRYAAGWLRAYREACEATHVRGEQSPEILDLRMTCLEDRRAALAALGDVLATADRLAVASAVDAAAALPAVEACGDVKLLRAEGEPPRDPATRARVDDLRRRAAAARSAYDTGRARPAVDEARRLVAEARTAGYAPALAEMLLLLGSFHPSAESAGEATHTLEEATFVALRARRDDLAAEAAAELAATAGSAGRGPAEAERWADMAEALLDRIGEGLPRVRAKVLQTRAVARETADPAEALRLARQALVLRRRALPPDHPDIGQSLVTEAECMHRTGDDAGALAMSGQAIDLLSGAYGRQSPLVARALSNRGAYLVALGRAKEAVPLFRDALARWEAHVGPDDAFLAVPLTGLGEALLADGRPAEARAPLERALRIREGREPDAAARAETRFALARALWPAGDRRRALALASAAAREYGPSTPPGREARAVTAWLAERER